MRDLSTYIKVLTPSTNSVQCVSHCLRKDIVRKSNVILTNPDILHSTILPQSWSIHHHDNEDDILYRPLLENLAYVIVDEAHMYEGVFGAHVAMILSRLCRIDELWWL